MIWTPERRALALATLAKWHGTPHRDRIAIVGVGIDCIQLVLEVFKDAGLIPRVEITGYDVQAGLHHQTDRLKRAFTSCLDMSEVDKEKPEFGDVVIFTTGKRSGHCAFYTSGEIWHALGERCVTHTDYELWVHRPVDMLLRLRSPGFTSNPQKAAKLL